MVHSQTNGEAATLEYNTKMALGSLICLREKRQLVFKVKHNQDGSIAKGYSQRPGLDYNESFAPTFRPATLRIIMALSAVEDLELPSVDITSAFTNGDLDEEIYTKQPEVHPTRCVDCASPCMDLSNLRVNGTRSYTLSWDSNTLNLTALSTSTPMEKSGSLFPSTLTTLPLSSTAI
jgi:hypothetical protein